MFIWFFSLLVCWNSVYIRAFMYIWEYSNLILFHLYLLNLCIALLKPFFQVFFFQQFLFSIVNFFGDSYSAFDDSSCLLLSLSLSSSLPHSFPQVTMIIYWNKFEWYENRLKIKTIQFNQILNKKTHGMNKQRKKWTCEKRINDWNEAWWVDV